MADTADSLDDELLDFSRRNRLRGTGLPAILLGSRASVVTVSLSSLGAMRWCHRAPTGDTPQQALQQGAELVANRGSAVATVALEDDLHALPHIGVDDAGVFAA